MQATIKVSTAGPGLYELTGDVTAFVRRYGPAGGAGGGPGNGEGLLTLFVQHTSCSIIIQENADPDVRADLQEFFRRLAPHTDDPSMAWVKHRTEGPDDMPAHMKAALLPTSLSIPIVGGKLALGKWQGVYLFEHRDEPQTRHVLAHLSA